MALGKLGIHAQKDGAGNYLTCHVNIDSTWVKSLNKRIKLWDKMHKRITAVLDLSEDCLDKIKTKKNAGRRQKELQVR